MWIKILNVFIFQVYKVLNYILQPNYYNETSNNDIALIRLEEAIFEPNFSPICLWSGGFKTGTNNNDRLSQETFMGFGRSGLDRIDLMSTSSKRNILKFIAGNSGAALLVYFRNRWYLKGIAEECSGPVCDYSSSTGDDKDGVTMVAHHIDWIKSYRSPAIASTNSSTLLATPSNIIIPLLMVGFLAAILIIIGAELIRRKRQSYPVSELPLMVPKNDVVLTNKKTWRFSHVS